MPLELAPVEDADFSKMIPFMFAAMGGNSIFINSVYPHNMDPAKHPMYAMIFNMISKSGSEQRWMKVVDTDANNEIVGVGQFLVYEGKKPESVLNLQRPGGYYDSDEDKEFAESLLVSFMERRKAVLEEVGDKPLVGEWVSFPSLFFFLCVFGTPPPLPV
jgi:hypothetical protein